MLALNPESKSTSIFSTLFWALPDRVLLPFDEAEVTSDENRGGGRRGTVIDAGGVEEAVVALLLLSKISAKVLRVEETGADSRGELLVPAAVAILRRLRKSENGERLGSVEEESAAFEAVERLMAIGLVVEGR
jgi:hypothetical protein